MDKVKIVSGSIDLQHAICALCKKPASEHVTADGFSCVEAKMVHPLRRAEDVVSFVPLQNVLSIGGRKRRRAAPTRGRKRRASHMKERRSTDTNADSRRGRIAGVYKPAEKLPDMDKLKLTDSIGKVFRVIKARKAGITQRDIAAKLAMPSGTVGWALGKLTKQRAIEHVTAAA